MKKIDHTSGTGEGSIKTFYNNLAHASSLILYPLPKGDTDTQTDSSCPQRQEDELPLLSFSSFQFPHFQSDTFLLLLLLRRRRRDKRPVFGRRCMARAIDKLAWKSSMPCFRCCCSLPVRFLLHCGERESRNFCHDWHIVLFPILNLCIQGHTTPPRSEGLFQIVSPLQSPVNHGLSLSLALHPFASPERSRAG